MTVTKQKVFVWMAADVLVRDWSTWLSLRKRTPVQLKGGGHCL